MTYRSRRIAEMSFRHVMGPQDKKELIGSINVFRERQGMKPIKMVWRACLGCDKRFKSTQDNVRMCDLCRSKE